MGGIFKISNFEKIITQIKKKKNISALFLVKTKLGFWF